MPFGRIYKWTDKEWRDIRTDYFVVPTYYQH